MALGILFPSDFHFNSLCYQSLCVNSQCTKYEGFVPVGCGCCRMDILAFTWMKQEEFELWVSLGYVTSFKQAWAARETYLNKLGLGLRI